VVTCVSTAIGSREDVEGHGVKVRLARSAIDILLRASTSSVLKALRTPHLHGRRDARSGVNRPIAR